MIEAKQCDREILPILLAKLGIQLIVAEDLKSAYELLKKDAASRINTILVSSEILDDEYLDFINWVKDFHSEICIIATTCRPSDEKVCSTRGIQFVPKPILNIRSLGQILKN